LIIPLFEKLLLIPSCSAILNRTQRPSVTFPVLNPFLATSSHNHFSSKALLRTLGFYLVIIIINIIVIGAYPHGYNYIIIYRVSCYFKRLIRPKFTAETTKQRPEFTAATTKAARWIGKNQTIIFTRCYYGASIQKLQRRQQDTDGTATPGVEPKFVPRANGGWKEFVPRANGGWKEFVTRANGGWKEIKKRKEKRFPIRGLDKEKKRDFPSGDWIKSGSERKRSERKNRNDKLTGCLATCS